MAFRKVQDLAVVEGCSELLGEADIVVARHGKLNANRFVLATMYSYSSARCYWSDVGKLSIVVSRVLIQPYVPKAGRLKKRLNDLY